MKNENFHRQISSLDKKELTSFSLPLLLFSGSNVNHVPVRSSSSSSSAKEWSSFRTEIKLMRQQHSLFALDFVRFCILKSFPFGYFLTTFTQPHSFPTDCKCVRSSSSNFRAQKEDEIKICKRNFYIKTSRGVARVEFLCLACIFRKCVFCIRFFRAVPCSICVLST